MNENNEKNVNEEGTAESAVSSKKKKSVGARITGAISTILVVIVVLFALLLVGVRLIGLKPFTVLSGSMEPTYHTGSLIYVKSVDPMTIEAGTPITFMLDENTIATHRVVGVVPDEEDPTVVRFRTKVRSSTVRTSSASPNFPYLILAISPITYRTRRANTSPSP